MRPLPLSSSKHSLSSRFPPRADPRRNPVESRREMRRVRLRLRRPGYVDCAHFDGVMSRAVEASLRGACASKLSFCDPTLTTTHGVVCNPYNHILYFGIIPIHNPSSIPPLTPLFRRRTLLYFLADQRPSLGGLVLPRGTLLVPSPPRGARADVTAARHGVRV